MEKVSTIQEVIDSMAERFQAPATKGVQAKYQWLISGDGGKEFCVHISDGEFEVLDGVVDDPSVTFKIDVGDYIRLVNNELKGMTAILTRKLQVNGNVFLANKMDLFFK